MGRRHEGRRLFVAGEDKLDRRAAQGFENVEILLAWDAEDPIDALIFEGGDEQFCTFRHGDSPGNERLMDVGKGEGESRGYRTLRESQHVSQTQGLGESVGTR